MQSRRDFLVRVPLGLAGLLAARKLRAQSTQPEAVPGATPAFNTGAGTGPAVTQGTFAEAEKLMQVRMSETHRAQAASSWRTAMAGTMERRVGPRRIALDAELAPATVWNPELPGHVAGPAQDRFEPAHVDAGPLPAHDTDIAFASVAAQGQWIRTRKLTSERLTKIYLARLERFDPKLRCVITLLEDHALAQARRRSDGWMTHCFAPRCARRTATWWHKAGPTRCVRRIRMRASTRTGNTSATRLRGMSACGSTTFS